MTIDAYKALIDTTITLQTAYKGISPYDLGTLLKIGADLSTTPDPIETALDGTGSYYNVSLIGAKILAVNIESVPLTTKATDAVPIPDCTLNKDSGVLTLHIGTSAGQKAFIYYTTQA